MTKSIGMMKRIWEMNEMSSRMNSTGSVKFDKGVI
jgi:hypothetical protein